MPLHHTNDLIFDLPSELKDRTHHIFTLRDTGPSDLTLVLSRQPIGEQETFTTYEATLLPELERALPDFKLIKKSHFHMADQLALLLEYRWSQQGQALHVLQAHLFHSAAAGERHVLQLIGTALGDFSQKWENAFYDFLRSVKLRKAAEAELAAGARPSPRSLG